MAVNTHADQPLVVDAWTFDPGTEAKSPGQFARQVFDQIQKSGRSGADIVLFPEYLWLGLGQFETDLKKLARLFWKTVWPQMRHEIPDNLLVVAGTAPWFSDDEKRLYNRAVISNGSYQDKLNLTPWESPFSTGDSLQLFELRGCKIAVLICLDIEVPEIAAVLRRQSVDLILVPSAT